MSRPIVHRDRGFTLPELLISIVVTATIGAVLLGVFTVVLRTTPTTEARANDARSMLGLVTWLPQDVDSTPETGFDTDPNPVGGTGCNVDPPGNTNLLKMKFTEELGSVTTTFVVSYIHLQIGDGYRLQRVTCSGTGTPPYSNGTKINLTSELPAIPASWTPGSAPFAVTKSASDPAIYTFEITTLSGETVRTDSASKNPDETLPPLAAPSWQPPTPTTNVFTNIAPEATDHTLSVYPGVVETQNLTVSDADGHTLIVNLIPPYPVGWTGILVGTTLSITAPASALPGASAEIFYEVDDQYGGVDTGKVTANVIGINTTTTTTSTTTTTTTTTTTMPPPQCILTGRAISQATVKNVQPDSHSQGSGNTNVGVLLDPITVTATTNEHCVGMEIRYTGGGVGSPPFVNLSQTSATTWSITLPGRDQGSSETWSDGDHNIFFYSSTGAAWGFVLLKVT